MRIGIVTTWFERGAAYVSRQYRTALQSQHQVYIYARGGEKRAIHDPLWDDETVTWGVPSVLPVESAVDLGDFRQWIEKHRIEIVLFNEQRWWDPVILCSRLGVIAGAYVDYYTRPTISLFGCYDFLVCNTRRHHSVFTWHPQAFYLPWGTDIELFKPVSLEPVEAGKVTFFHSAGMNTVRKGTDFVLEAFRKLGPAARLVIHTQNGFAGIEHLEPLARSLQQEGRLQICDRTVGAPGLYHLGDVYVYPSRLDGIGLTVAEAIACGLPAIVSDEPPMNEFLDESSGALVRIAGHKEREDGYYWPMCMVDADSLVEKMQAYAANPNGIAAAKQAARHYAEKHLNWMENSRSLAPQMAKLKPLPLSQKQDAIERAQAFEKHRAKGSPRLWASYYFPTATRAARAVFRSFRKTSV